MDELGKIVPTNKMDINKIIDLLNSRKKQSIYFSVLRRMSIPQKNDNDLEKKLIAAIEYFQKHFQKMNSPDGVISPTGNTILFLGGIRSSGKIILVDLDDQNLFAYKGSRLVYEFYSASGDRTHPTARRPSLHKTTRKYKIYRSKKYDA